MDRLPVAAAAGAGQREGRGQQSQGLAHAQRRKFSLVVAYARVFF